MTRPTPPKLGQPLDLTDEQIDQAAAVTPLDMAVADALWRASVKPTLTDLLNATPENDDNGPAASA